MKFAAKTLFRSVVLAIVSPVVALVWLQSRLLRPHVVFSGWTQTFALLPGVTGEFLRHALYRCLAAECGEDACISFGTTAAYPEIRIGNRAYIGQFCTLGNITIEDDVLIASHVSIVNGCRQHGTARLDIPIREQPGEFEPITIGHGSWIGEHATVAASVGRECIVGAGSLVLKPLPDYAIAVGVPARIIGDRRDNAAPDRRHTDAQSIEMANLVTR